MEKLTLEMADKIASGVINCIKRNNFKPVTVNILDSAGDPIVRKRMEGCTPIGIPDFAFAKANTCIGMKDSSRGFAEKFTGGSPRMYCMAMSMVEIAGGKMAPF